MQTAEVARRFTAFFASRDHLVVPSASLIAADPTLLLVNAGMVPFKPYFLGELPPLAPRATSVQKCVRTVDIDNVGQTTRHASFFQMCGNFSFGDYFKQRAIPLAWELLTTPVDSGGYGLSPDRLWSTVYVEDDESAGIWQQVSGLPAERIQRRGKEDNFWDMGVPGPCGPCSEVFYDRGPEYGRDGGPAADEARYVELWNLVFMQYERGPGTGKDYPILRDLPARNIDTGLGLERLAMFLQGVPNLYEIDQVRSVLDRASALTGRAYGTDPRGDVSLRVVADHVRTAVMLISDGVRPGNEGRDYVLRRMLRRAVRHLRLLGSHEPLLSELAATSIEAMGPAYPELAAERARIDAVVAAEETAFLATLRTGTALFDTAVDQTRSTGAAVIPAERAFALHDTYGFPIDLTLEMAAEQDLSVDEEGFRRLMAQQRERAKQDSVARKTGHLDLSVYRSVLAAAGETTFTGYAEVETEAVVRSLLRAGDSVTAVSEGDECELVLDRTPFYAEAGGQLADQGQVVTSGAELDVLDVQRPLPGLVIHRVRVTRGELAVGTAGQARVDVERRRSISRAHTATHLIHRALRGALGEAAAQAGSQNAPGRLRFDFSSASAVDPSVLRDVEDEVNAILTDDLPVRAFVTDQEEARRIGALALFGEKYGKTVRVVEVGDYARELCGGTHALRSGQLGLVTILSESSIGSGVRRVEALVGLDAFRFLAREHVLVGQLAELVKAPADQLPDRIAGLIARLREGDKELERLRAQAVLAGAAGLASDAADVEGVAVVAHAAPAGTAADDLRRLALDVRGRIGPARPAVVALAADTGGRVALVVAVNEAGRSQGLSAAELVRLVGPMLGGRGGGKDDVAQGGGSDVAAIPMALAQLTDAIGQRVAGRA